MARSPLVSIVIPSKDEGEWLRRTVDAVAATTAADDAEIIVVDDGSADGSAGYLRRGEGPANARVVEGGGLGVARARNLGAEHAAGEYLVFVDANVVPEAGWLDELIEVLRPPDVALAGVAVSDYDHPEAVGYSNTFVNERIQGGWAAPRSLSEPFEAVSVIGCCVAARREVFEELGGFDPGHQLWGVEDIELGVRAWHLGYRCVVSPKAKVAHFFKYDKPRSFEVPWELYDVNVLRFAYTYLGGRRLAAVLADAKARPSFARSLELAVGNADFWQRRRELRRRFLRDEAWFFQRLAPETRDFEERVAAIVAGLQPTWSMGEGDPVALDREVCDLAGLLDEATPGQLAAHIERLAARGSLTATFISLAESGFLEWIDSAGPDDRARCIYDWRTAGIDDGVGLAGGAREEGSMVTQRRQRCANCNAVNVGVQDKCMLCGAALAEGSDLDDWRQALATNIARTCPSCQASLAEGARFCIACGTPVEAASAAPSEAAVCRNCGAMLAPDARFCLSCGTAVNVPTMACRQCGSQLAEGARFCVNCGTAAS